VSNNFSFLSVSRPDPLHAGLCMFSYPLVVASHLFVHCSRNLSLLFHCLVFPIKTPILCAISVSCGKSESQRGWTALMRAAENGRFECVRLLLEAGADKDARTNVRRWSLLFLD
jgi:hypothetical protein